MFSNWEANIISVATATAMAAVATAAQTNCKHKITPDRGHLNTTRTFSSMNSLFHLLRALTHWSTLKRGDEYICQWTGLSSIQSMLCPWSAWSDSLTQCWLLKHRENFKSKWNTIESKYCELTWYQMRYKSFIAMFSRTTGDRVSSPLS